MVVKMHAYYIFFVLAILACVTVFVSAVTENADTKADEEVKVDEEKLTYAKGSACKYCEYCKVWRVDIGLINLCIKIYNREKWQLKYKSHTCTYIIKID